MNPIKTTQITAKENRTIVRLFRQLINAWSTPKNDTKEHRELIKRAFRFACDAHKDMRRRSGEPYIYHPIGVAIICAKELGLGTTSIVCALLHDVVEDTHYSVGEIESLFSPRIAKIIEGLTKISGVVDTNKEEMMAINHQKIVLTLAIDVRIMLIKMADRLNNMRTLDAMPPIKQIAISKETHSLYVPLAHRLGLYAIKSELEDLCLKYLEPDTYKDIAHKLKDKLAEHQSKIRNFILPIKERLAHEGVQFSIVERAKTVYSIWEKMVKKGVSFEEVYDIFAIRIIIDTPPKTEENKTLKQHEKNVCMSVYTTVSELYKPRMDRFRDWISNPKANGYTALHTTVMSPFGWVEVQIRTVRMDEIAEKGFAAHWKYKEGAEDENNLDNWLDRVRDHLEQAYKGDAETFMSDLQGYLFSKEVFVFTRGGEQRLFPAGSSILDFAYGIHTEIGRHCIGASVNHQLKNREYILQNGDQINILTSNATQPDDKWLKIVLTTRAKDTIRLQLKEKKRNYREEGEQKLEKMFKQLGITYGKSSVEDLMKQLGYSSIIDICYDAALKKIDVNQIKKAFDIESHRWYNPSGMFSYNKLSKKKTDKNTDKHKTKELVINPTEWEKTTMASCCHPIKGDNVIGVMTKKEGIVVHRKSCSKAKKLLKANPQCQIKIRWNEETSIDFLAGIYFEGIDRKALINDLTRVILQFGNVNIKSLTIRTEDTIFTGELTLYVNDTQQLDTLISNIKKLTGIERIYRVNRDVAHRSLSNQPEN